MEFGDYVAQRRPALMRFATVLTGQAWLADDIVSDVLGRAYERWDRIAAMAEPNAYVRRMVVNDFLSWRRRLARTAPRAEIDGGEDADSSAAQADRDDMVARLARLPRRQRAAVVLRYYLDLPDADIAAHLGCKPPTVRSQISRALATLRLDLSNTPVNVETT